jgi:hypothetical protein
MPDRPSEPVVFPCPKCTRFVVADPGELDKVRPLTSRKGGPLLIRVTCPTCGCEILRTVSR